MYQNNTLQFITSMLILTTYTINSLKNKSTTLPINNNITINLT